MENIENSEINKNDLLKLNELIFKKKQDKEVTWKEAFFTKWLIGVWIALVLILGICLYQFITKQQNIILLCVEKIVISLSFMYCFLH